MGISTFSPDMRVFIAQKPGVSFNRSSCFTGFFFPPPPLHLPIIPLGVFSSSLYPSIFHSLVVQDAFSQSSTIFSRIFKAHLPQFMGLSAAIAVALSPVVPGIQSCADRQAS